MSDDNNTNKKSPKKQKKKRTLFQKIVNGFIGFFIGLFVIILLFVGFSQTSTFREFVRTNLLDIVNSSIEGKLDLEKIDGTIFTSLILHNASLTYQNDTIASIKKVAVKISPLQVLLKRIVVREAFITDLYLKAVEDSSGILNFAKAFPPSEEEDTSESAFDYQIIVSDFRLINSDIAYRKDLYRDSFKDKYDSLNTNDLKCSGLNLELNTSVNLAENRYEVNIEKFNSDFNIKGVSLKDFKGEFVLDESRIELNNLNLATDSSNINLGINIKGVNLFRDSLDSQLANAVVGISGKSDRLYFSDFYPFVPALEMLSGAIGFDIELVAENSKLDINKFDVTTGDTELKLTGSVSNFMDSGQLYASINANNSKIIYKDITSLLKSVKLPPYKFTTPIIIDTLQLAGGMKNIKAGYAFRMEGGSLSGSTSLDMSAKDYSYELGLITNKLNISPITGFPVVLNSNAKFKGKGISPENINLTGEINLKNCNINNILLSEFQLKTEFEKSKGELNIEGDLDSSQINFNLLTDFSDLDSISYDFNGYLKEINPGRIYLPFLVTEKFNVFFNGNGFNFNPENLHSELNLDITKLNLLENDLRDINLNAVVHSGENSKKLIDIKSTLFDVFVEGNFNYSSLTDFLLEEIDSLAERFAKKQNEYFPVKENEEQNIADSKISGNKIIKNKVQSPFFISNKKGKINIKSKSKEKENLLNADMGLKFKMNFKDLEPLAVLMKSEELLADGWIEGEIKKDASQTEYKTKLNFDFLKYKSNDNIIFLTETTFFLDFLHPQDDFEFNNLELNSGIQMKRLFFNSEITDINVDLNLKNNRLETKISADVTPELSVKSVFASDFEAPNIFAAIEDLQIDYKKFTLKNERSFTIDYLDERIEISGFNLHRGDSYVFIDGIVDPAGEQDLKISLKNFKGYDIGYNLLEINTLDMIDYDAEIIAEIKGTFQNPKMALNFNVANLTYRDKKFGSLTSSFAYNDQNLDVDIIFTDPNLPDGSVPLKIEGFVPIDLSLSSVENRLPEDKDINLKVFARNFNLSTFGDALPFIDELSGVLSSDIVLSGNYKNLSRNGLLSIRDAAFIVEANNLKYSAGIVVRLEEESLFLDSLLIANVLDASSGTSSKYSGTMRGSGKIGFEGLEITSSQFLINGNLLVLSDDSKPVSPLVYGDLFLGTEGDIIFVQTPERSFLHSYIRILHADLFFPPLQSSYSGASSNFIYKYLDVEKEISDREIEIQRLISEAAANKEIKSSSTKSSDLDYDIKVKITNEAKITFVLAEAANQKLIANLKGELNYEKNNGIQNIQGELKLLEGSTLEFLKTFTAEGSIKFESDITDPYLDITAIYKNYHIATEGSSAGKEVEVAVKIRLRGAVSELSNNFASMQDNIAVYEGTENIQNNKASSDKDKSDAIWFILAGKFANEITSQEKQQSVGMLEGTATSLAGSLLGGVLNTYLGDYVRSLDFRSVGNATKFSLSGTFKGLKYTIGGTTNFLQDLSNANIRIEYPLIESLFIRIERKENIIEDYSTNEMINELGIKYRFEF